MIRRVAPDDERPTKEEVAVPMDRPVYGTRKHRASDLRPGDVTRNKFGKWDEVSAVSPHSDHLYVTVQTVCGGGQQHRTVQLLEVQVVKPS